MAGQAFRGWKDPGQSHTEERVKKAKAQRKTGAYSGQRAAESEKLIGEFRLAFKPNYIPQNDEEAIFKAAFASKILAYAI